MGERAGRRSRLHLDELGEHDGARAAHGGEEVDGEERRPQVPRLEEEVEEDLEDVGVGRRLGLERVERRGRRAHVRAARVGARRQRVGEEEGGA